MDNTDFNWDPNAVANYIVDFANQNSKPLTNLKLQKVLYFLQAAFLVDHNLTLMDIEFSRWQYGPVSRDVYYNFNDRGALQIREKTSVLNMENFSFSVPTLTDIPENIQQALNRYIDTLLDYSASQLVTETHNQAIWADYQDDISRHMAPEYTDDEIRDYFVNHEEDRIWI